MSEKRSYNDRANHRNAVMNRAAAIFFTPIVITFPIIIIMQMMTKEYDICLFGGEYYPATSMDDEHWDCNEVPKPIAFFPFLWFFALQPYVFYMLHWAHNQIDTTKGRL